MAVKDPQLERQGRRVGRAGGLWLIVSALLLVPGVALVVVGLAVGPRILWEVGIAVLLIGGGPAVISWALLGASAVSRWSSRRKLFA
jgi:hypothetical protein